MARLSQILAFCLLTIFIADVISVPANPYNKQHARVNTARAALNKHRKPIRRSGTRYDKSVHAPKQRYTTLAGRLASQKTAPAPEAVITEQPEQQASRSVDPAQAEPAARTRANVQSEPAKARSHEDSSCPKGLYLLKDACVACEDYHAPTDCTDCKPPHECRHMVCPAGHYRSGGSCKACPIGTWVKEGLNMECNTCPGVRTTLQTGAKSVEQCVCPEGGAAGPNCNECPTNMMLLENGLCGCSAGHGGKNCAECKPGFYSVGGDADTPYRPCKPCGAHLTSPAGAVSAGFCECEAGYGADNTDAPMEERECVPCKYGTYNPGNAATAVQIPSMTVNSSAVSIAAIEIMQKRKQKKVPQILPCQQCSERNPDGGFTTLEIGAKSSSQCVCKPGYAGLDCAACEEGRFSLGGKGATCQSCPYNGVGYSTVPKRAATSAEACVCRAGFGGNELGVCKRCPANTYSNGDSRDECSPCPFGTTSAPGAKGADDCHAVAQLCPPGQTAPVGAVSQQECGCYPGYGGGGHPDAPCTICPAGTWAIGGNLEACKPCNFGFTSSVGSTSEQSCIPVGQCPAGTEIPRDAAGVSIKECMCKAGYGSSNGEGPCHMCPVGTYSEGASLEDCKPCPFGTTSEAGARAREQCKQVAQTCPVGQIAPPGALSRLQCGCLPGYGGGAAPTDACTICPAGTYASGGDTQPCKPCTFGFTSPAGSTSEEQCYPTNACPAGSELVTYTDAPASVGDCVCKPGFGTNSGSRLCELCPPDTYSAGGTLEGCRPCAFGTTSAAGSTSKEQCQNSPQACPIGQWAPEAAVSKQQCVCYPGFGAGNSPSDPCTICPPGTFSDGQGLEKCMPCGAGYTSPEGSTSADDCTPVNQCPAGTDALPVHSEPDRAAPQPDCVCKPGYGSPTGTAPCTMCPVGTYSNGGTLEDCKPCPYGYTSNPGTSSIYECVKNKLECPHGQIASPDADSPSDCVCYPGYGGEGESSSYCHVCPAGTWSPGNSTEPCIPCGFGFTSPPGSTCESACYAANACPVGTEVHRSLEKATSLADCVCKPGFGAVPGASICHLCPAGTYAYGGAMEECEPCPYGTTSAPGSEGVDECEAVKQVCPAGQSAALGAVTAEDCACLPGFGGGDRPTDPCHICPAGTWSPGGTTRECIPCGYGRISPPGSTDDADCVDVEPTIDETCPEGQVDWSDGTSGVKCACRPGFGGGNNPWDACHICPAGTWSSGGTTHRCTLCQPGYTSIEGAASEKECYKAHIGFDCPAGAELKQGVDDADSFDDCVCKAGYGASPLASEPGCYLCSEGTFSLGGTLDECEECPPGTSSSEGATSLHECHATEVVCPSGRWAPSGSSSVKQCRCLPGYAGDSDPRQPCTKCPAGSYSSGASRSDDASECSSCPPGYTSEEGASNCYKEEEEEPLSQRGVGRVAELCPLGQWAPDDAVSVEECRCYKGFAGGPKPDDPCTVCPAGTYAPRDSDACIPCPSGFTSVEGSDECFPEDDSPPGTDWYETLQGRQCKCKPGYGSVNGFASCQLCPVGMYSEGGELEECELCPFGHTSKPGATSRDDCIPLGQDCPAGQIAPVGSTSREECGCAPGYGSGSDEPMGECRLCPPGTWSLGGEIQPCIPCEYGYTTSTGAWTPQLCTELNACPAGTQHKGGDDGPFSRDDCVCKPGYGAATGSGICRVCPAGTFSPGGDMEECQRCLDSKTSKPGATSQDECYPRGDETPGELEVISNGQAQSPPSSVKASPSPSPEVAKQNPALRSGDIFMPMDTPKPHNHAAPHQRSDSIFLTYPGAGGSPHGKRAAAQLKKKKKKTQKTSHNSHAGSWKSQPPAAEAEAPAPVEEPKVAQQKPTDTQPALASPQNQTQASTGGGQPQHLQSANVTTNGTLQQPAQAPVPQGKPPPSAAGDVTLKQPAQAPAPQGKPTPSATSDVTLKQPAQAPAPQGKPTPSATSDGTLKQPAQAPAPQSKPTPSATSDVTLKQPAQAPAPQGKPTPSATSDGTLKQPAQAPAPQGKLTPSATSDGTLKQPAQAPVPQEKPAPSASSPAKPLPPVDSTKPGGAVPTKPEETPATNAKQQEALALQQALAAGTPRHTADGAQAQQTANADVHAPTTTSAANKPQQPSQAANSQQSSTPLSNKPSQVLPDVGKDGPVQGAVKPGAGTGTPVPNKTGNGTLSPTAGIEPTKA